MSECWLSATLRRLVTEIAHEVAQVCNRRSLTMNSRRLTIGTIVALVVTISAAGTAEAQPRDITQISPTVPGGAINKSYAQEIGAGRGDLVTPGSSLFIINRDPF